MITLRHDRIGLNPPAYALWELASEECRANEAGEEYFSAPLQRLCDHCQCNALEIGSTVTDLQMAGLVEFRTRVDDVIVLRVIRRAWVGRG